MTDSITVNVREISGEFMLDSQAMALAFGVEEVAVCALPIVDGHMRIPREWARRGKRRAREAMAHTGSDFILDVLGYWARHEHNADIKVVYHQ